MGAQHIEKCTHFIAEVCSKPAEKNVKIKHFGFSLHKGDDVSKTRSEKEELRKRRVKNILKLGQEILELVELL